MSITIKPDVLRAERLLAELGAEIETERWLSHLGLTEARDRWDVFAAAESDMSEVL